MKLLFYDADRQRIGDPITDDAFLAEVEIPQESALPQRGDGVRLKTGWGTFERLVKTVTYQFEQGKLPMVIYALTEQGVKK